MEDSDNYSNCDNNEYNKGGEDTDADHTVSVK